MKIGESKAIIKAKSIKIINDPKQIDLEDSIKDIEKTKNL